MLLKTKINQNDKNDCRCHRSCLPAQLNRKFGGKTVNASYIRKALAKSGLILSWKCPDCYPRTGFYAWMAPTSTLLAQSRNSNGIEGVTMIHHLSYLLDFTSADFISSWGQSQNSQTFCWPRKASRQACWGSSEPSPKMRLLLPFGNS